MLERKIYQQTKNLYMMWMHFLGIFLRDEPFTKKVLREVEQASYVDGQQFKDRFGRLLPTFCLSTSSKLLLTANRHRDIVLNCSEIGKNAIALFWNYRMRNCISEVVFLPFGAVVNVMLL